MGLHTLRFLEMLQVYYGRHRYPDNGGKSLGRTTVSALASPLPPVNGSKR